MKIIINSIFEWSYQSFQSLNKEVKVTNYKNLKNNHILPSKYVKNVRYFIAFTLK